MLGHPDDAAHVAGCVDCQARLSLTGLDVDLDRVWTGVAVGVWARPVRWHERLAGSLLGSPGLARALLTTPSLVFSWILASAAVLAVGVFFTNSSANYSEVPWVALLAPALAGIAIAYAYGPGVDPAFELSQTMTISDRMVLLVRGLAVFGVNAALGIVASLFTQGALSITLGWLVPMTAVSALALAGATLSRSANVGVAAALSGWGMMVLASASWRGNLSAAVLEGALVPVYVAVAGICLVLALYATSGRRSEVLRWH